ncbi:NACHT, LRR and PYD domains-containing protein 12-like [Xiphophorus hellerii]|uniref:NACHT, LRR and PYD domains-containing protein 12-like n=1 Tax=Xiphophorus hellerii TaxID=8084 RepID=UPI0013B3FB90|nr:NACHT, LRR and PYD domains-containing protein 12-like [Xiphophorus hellerii]XP_032412054.1 NACHT, LRR and PYD domains-containing protein 12-like [Xiphophorus hellerii]
MDQREDREDRVRPSKASLCAGHKDIRNQPEPRTEPGAEPGPEPGPSCVSFKSDGSKDNPLINFKRLNIPESENDQRISGVPEDAAFPQLDSIFKLLEIKIVSFVQNELKKIHQVLCSNYPECLTCSMDVEDEEKISREAFLKIIHQFLRNMKQEELADQFQNKMYGGVHQHHFKSSLKTKFQCVFEGITKAGNPTLLNQIYTELYITEGGTGEVNQEHEVRQIETASRKQETTIRREDIFKVQPGRDQPIRTVMTKGVAGIGKTVLTQKFTLDWAEDKTNQNIQFIFPFTFRELNVLRDKKFSLVELIHRFFTETKGIFSFEQFQVLFIFDGLDESRLGLDFNNTKILTDPEKSTSLDVLVTNLIRGHLLPSALLWITTRPAAANQIPPGYIDMVIDIGGFNDPQKEEYFRKRFSDEDQANKIISHIKASPTLHILCYIPVFCWITATVLEDIEKTSKSRGLPKTLTEMYIHFLVVQTKVMKVKYDGGSETDPHWSPESRKMIESLGKLAFDQLQKGNLIFYESDLTECGIDIRAASVYSGVFTQIFREERGLYQDKVFCFVHLSVQEFLAALHVHLTFTERCENLMDKNTFVEEPDLNVLYQSAVEKALDSLNGHLDLFLRFLLGLSLQTNQSLLKGLLKWTTNNSQRNQHTVQCIKKYTEKSLCFEKMLCLFHCLNEIKYSSVVEEIQQYLTSGRLRTQDLSPAEWSDLVSIILSSESNMDVFELKNYDDSENVLLMLLPVVKVSITALLAGCGLFRRTCEALSSILSSPTCSIMDLDLSNNNLEDSGLNILLLGVKNLDCKLEIVRLSRCNLSDKSCESLSSLFCSRPCSLRELDLSSNSLQDSGVKQLCAGLQSSHCKLETLRLSLCYLSDRSCQAICFILSSQTSLLRVLDMSNNDLQDSGVQLLCEGLESPNCKLESLSLSGCMVTEEGCASLALTLSSKPSALKQLDLSYNHPGESGLKLLPTGLDDPNWRLETLRVEPAGVRWLTPGLRKYSCQLTVDRNSVTGNLKLSEDDMKVTRVEEKIVPEYEESYQLLCSNGLTGRCYWEVEWTGEIDVSVNRERKEEEKDRDSPLELMDFSWSLGCSDTGYSIRKDNNKLSLVAFSDQPVSPKIAMYLDCPAGTLSFFSVDSDSLSHIHTFNAVIAEPLYVGLNFFFTNSVSSVRTSVPLC